MAGRDYEGFKERCKEAQREAFSFKNPLLVHHYDADGISAAAIVVKAFLQKNRKIRRVWIRTLDDEFFEKYAKENEIIFADLGSGNRRVNELKDVVILDHHQPLPEIEKMQANPLLFGIDGGEEISAAGVAYSVFKQMPELAVVGAVGDVQTPLKGLNRMIVEEGEKEGKIKREYDLIFYGRYSRPLKTYICYAQPPIPGVSWNEEETAKFLEKVGIDKNKKYTQLDKEEKKRLIEAIISIFIENNLTPEIFGESYIFPQNPQDERYEAHEFATLLNSCGRHNRADLGVEICLGRKIEEGRKLLEFHRREIKNALRFAWNKLQDFGAFYFLDGRGKIEDSIIGIVCGMMMREKPIIGIANKGEELKVSMRTDGSINAGKVLQKTMERIGGVGGGHKAAGGATLPKGKLAEFLEVCGEYIKQERDSQTIHH